MKNFKYLFFVPVVIVMYSCAGFKLKNISECDINEQIITQKLKSHSYKIREGVIRKVYSDSLNNSNCEGLFYVEVLKWEGVKTDLNYVSIPIAISHDTIFMNMLYTNGTVKTNGNNIEAELLEIEKRFNMSFSKEQLETIKDKYKFGIQISSKVHFF